MKKKILIIDDESDFCLIMRNYFVKKGYEVSLAYTLRDGMAMAKEMSPDILFLDNNLPDGNGWDAVGNIVELFPHIRAYLVSAHRNKSSINGFDENITVWEKPISLHTLNLYF
jgi:DNA-binding response OmpR family regulator